MNKKSKKIFILLEGVNFGGQQLYVFNIFSCIKNSKYPIECRAGYLFDESTELLSQLSNVFESVHHCRLHSRSKKKLFFRPHKSLFNIIKILSHIKLQKPNVLLSNGFYSFFFCALYKFFNPKISHFRLIGGDLVRNEAFYFKNNLLRKVFPLYNYTDKIFGFINQKEYYSQLNIDIRKVIFDFNPIAAVNSELFKPLESSKLNLIRKLYNVNNVDFTIGWVGRISDDKEIWETLKVCKYIKSNYSGIKFKFIVIGDGWKRKEFEELILQDNLSNEYIRIDSKSQSELVELYSLIDFELLLDNDPMGGSHIREAMSCGRVVISVNGPSGIQAELIRDSQTGFLVHPENRITDSGDLILREYKNKDRLREIGLKARLYIQNNSYNKLADILLREIYN